ncbi:hypothetical protein LAZ67_4001198 [Cordylochernes scorpioides]|uniref:Glucosidase II beta subunit N-terminal domain-containing protein n=1 Tax=Cordylochernes scorpioides TaxID=51811 RepID=A0ABY6KBP6_9ARAC|nr:hypothetical protein LAZ67_4001198 [Cordylochernes scorpioides]
MFRLHFFQASRKTLWRIICAHRFYCTTQSSQTTPVWVLSSRVNDGVCDCCDGSDEWAGVVIPISSRLSAKIQTDLKAFQTPCPDRCKGTRR